MGRKIQDIAGYRAPCGRSWRRRPGRSAARQRVILGLIVVTLELDSGNSIQGPAEYPDRAMPSNNAYAAYLMVSQFRALYVGVTVDLERRVWKHKNTLSRGSTDPESSSG